MNVQSNVKNQECHIAKIPLKDILWYCIVSIFLEVNDVANMERAFTNKTFYCYQNSEGIRQGLFMDVDWDSTTIPIAISNAHQINWLCQRNIRLYNVKCITLRNYEIGLLLQTSRHLLHTVNFSECKNEIDKNTLRLISENCGGNLQTVSFSGCDILSNIRTLTNICNRIKSLNIQSVYRMDDTDCIALAKDLPYLTELDVSYCDKITNSGIRALASISNLESLSISGCPRISVNANCIREVSKGCPNLRKFHISRLRVDASSMLALVRSCQKLEEINMYGCKDVTDEIIHIIAEHVGRRLKNFYIGDCDGIENADNCLINLARSCPNLRDINFSYLNFSDYTLEALGKHCSGIRDIDFCSCYHITDTGIEALVNGNKYICNIRLYGCNLTDRSLRALLTCTNLIGLDARECDQMTKQAFDLVALKPTVTLLLS